MEWYVKRHDFNSDKIVDFDIFDSARFTRCLDEIMSDVERKVDFKNELQRALAYSFWGKAEYEVMISGISEKSKAFKIDVYEQVLPNLDILAQYILDNYDK